MRSAVEMLAEAIGYPERVSEGALSFTFRVDDVSIPARVSGGCLLLRWDFPEAVPPGTLAAYAAGRILREEAVVAWDPAKERAFLWQKAPKGADGRALAETFRRFLWSRDWWAERVAELTAPKTKPAELLIRP